jgi:general secretion pathway protein L
VITALGQLDGKHGKAVELSLQIPESRVLRKVVSLPLAAEENLRQVLGYAMDRETPFRAEQVYYDFRIVDRDRATKRLRVELVVVPRAELDEVLDRLAGLGLYPDLAAPAAGDLEESPLNLLPPERRRDRAPTWKVLNTALAVAAGVLLLVAVALPLWQRRQAVSWIESRVAEVKNEARAVEDLRRQIDGLAADARFLADRKRSSPVTISVLAELSRVLPDDTWLYQFEINGTELLVQGESTTSSAVIGLVEASPLFRNAAFRSPVTQNRVTGAERFNLSAEVVPDVPS